MNEKELGIRFAAGDEPELEEVIGVYGERLLRYSTSILCNHQDAEDVVQQVFLLAYQKRGSFDGRHLSAWLHKITYTRSINHLKKRKTLLFGDIRQFGEATTNPFEEGAVNDDFMEALGRLKAEDRALLYGRIMDEQSYEELSQVLGRSPAALRKQYERAKKKLAGLLNAKGEFLERGRRNECEQI
ncbi:MAG: RNA polymerase sigma factor [Defluviitaleaceae bacterium]|nr:RNA polymerase sigma factor [Defluviitaleaceae bacterium]